MLSWSLQAVWYLKCRALTLKNWIDDTEIEEEVSVVLCCPQQPAAEGLGPAATCQPVRSSTMHGLRNGRASQGCLIRRKAPAC